jgi:hypothetical protein
MLSNVAKTCVTSITGATLLAVLLSGCAGDAADSLTLAQTKSPVQLLRNDAAGRIPTTIIDEVEVVADGSEACLDEDEDPLGLSRSWNSTAIVTIEKAAESQIRSVFDDLIASYVEQGWSSQEAGGTLTAKTTRLRSDTSVAEIRVSSLLPELTSEQTSADDDSRVSRIQIEVFGP